MFKVKQIEYYDNYIVMSMTKEYYDNLLAQVIEMQEIKDKATRKCLEVELARRPVGIDEAEDQFHSAKKKLEDRLCAIDLL
eukprot:3041110-Amphidinium_carterae.1